MSVAGDYLLRGCKLRGQIRTRTVPKIAFNSIQLFPGRYTTSALGSSSFIRIQQTPCSILGRWGFFGRFTLLLKVGLALSWHRAPFYRSTASLELGFTLLAIYTLCSFTHILIHRFPELTLHPTKLVVFQSTSPRSQVQSNYTLSLTQIAPRHPALITPVNNPYGSAFLASCSTA